MSSPALYINCWGGRCLTYVGTEGSPSPEQVLSPQLGFLANGDPAPRRFVIEEDGMLILAVPLPASAWMGLALLGGLGVVGAVRRGMCGAS